MLLMGERSEMPILPEMPWILFILLSPGTGWCKQNLQTQWSKEETVQSIKYIEHLLCTGHRLKLWVICFGQKERRGKNNLGCWAIFPRRKCQIHIRRQRLDDLGWPTGFMYKSKWQHASLLSYQLCSPFGHSLPGQSCARLLNWLFYTHYMHFLSTYFPPHPLWLAFHFQQGAKFLLVKVTKHLI